MDSTAQKTLALLIRSTRIAALGTLHDGKPNLAMVAYAFADDFSAFYIHISRLGKHTADMEKDSAVGLLITEADDHRIDPQTLARASIHGNAAMIARTSQEYESIKAIYLSRFPEAEQLFSFGDFNLWRISPSGGRFVAGFGQAFNLESEALINASKQ